MIAADAPCPLFEASPADPTVEVAERQLAMLGEVAQIAMVLSRAYGAAAIAAAHAVEEILADEYYQPETGRARALAGSRDAAEGFRKVSRSLRLTLVLEMKTAETLRDLRAGIATDGGARGHDAGGPPAVLAGAVDLHRGRPTGSSSADAAADFDKPERDFERLYDIERPDRLPQGTFREVVDDLCAYIGVAPDWTRWRVGRPKLDYEPLRPRLPGETETRPPGSAPELDDAVIANRSTHPPPG